MEEIDPEAQARSEALNSFIEQKFEDRRKLQKVLDEYAELDESFAKLKETSAKTKIMPLMVPLSEKGMMSGYVEAPVKVTVAIGDNYFIKCDIDKARKILADRRKAVLKAEDNLNKEIERLTGVKTKPRKEPKSFEKILTPDGFVDIHEEYDGTSSEEESNNSVQNKNQHGVFTPIIQESKEVVPANSQELKEKPSLFKQMKETEIQGEKKPPVGIPTVSPAVKAEPVIPLVGAQKKPAPVVIPTVKKMTPEEREASDRLDHDVVKFNFESVNRAQKSEQLSRSIAQTSTSPSPTPLSTQPQQKVSKFRQERQKGTQ